VGDIRFLCEHCGARLKVDDAVSGYLVPCPECAKQITIPVESDARMAQPGDDSGPVLTKDEIDFLSKGE
jgi:hypothetical protein